MFSSSVPETVHILFLLDIVAVRVVLWVSLLFRVVLLKYNIIFPSYATHELVSTRFCKEFPNSNKTAIEWLPRASVTGL